MICRPVIEGPADDAGIGGLGVTDQAGFMNVLAGQSDVGGGRWPNIVTFWNDVRANRTFGNLAPFLRRVVFVSKRGVLDTPRFSAHGRFEMNGVDVAALILAENVERRNLSAGQRAMARAMLKPEGELTGVSDKHAVGTGYRRISHPHVLE